MYTEINTIKLTHTHTHTQAARAAYLSSGEMVLKGDLVSEMRYNNDIFALWFFIQGAFTVYQKGIWIHQILIYLERERE